MKLTLPLSSVRALAIVAVSSRFLMGIFLDMPWLYNAAWLSALGATLLCAPLGLLIDRFARANDARSALEALEAHSGRLLTRCVSMLFCLICAYETAVTARVLSNTVRHVALSESSALSLLLPLLLAAMLAACLNGQAVGSAARVWLKFVPVLLLIVVLIQAKSYRLQWLFPLLGPGLETLADGAVGGAGWLSLFALLWLCAQRDEGAPSRSGALLPMLATGAACALLLALLGDHDAAERAHGSYAHLSTRQAALQRPGLAGFATSPHFAMVQRTDLWDDDGGFPFGEVFADSPPTPGWTPGRIVVRINGLRRGDAGAG